MKQIECCGDCPFWGQVADQMDLCMHPEIMARRRKRDRCLLSTKEIVKCHMKELRSLSYGADDDCDLEEVCGA